MRTGPVEGGYRFLLRSPAGKCLKSSENCAILQSLTIGLDQIIILRRINSFHAEDPCKNCGHESHCGAIFKKGGQVKKKKQGYKDRKDESIAMRIKKKRTKKQLKDSRDESYGKFGSKAKKSGKINR